MITPRNYYNHSDHCSNVIIRNEKKQSDILKTAKAIVGTVPNHSDHCLNVIIRNDLKVNRNDLKVNPGFSVTNIITLK